MSLHLVTEILFILAGVVLAVVAVTVSGLLIYQLILGRGAGVTRKPRRGREERPQ